MEYSYIRDNADRIAKYLNTIKDRNGKFSISSHRRFLKAHNPESAFCEDICNSLGIRMKELNYVIEKGYDNVTFVCKKCGKKLKDICRGKSYCSHSCASRSEEVLGKIHEYAKKEREKYNKNFEIIKRDDIDVTMKSIRDNDKRLRTYLDRIKDSIGAPNRSTHGKLLNSSDEEALFTHKILQEYGIALKELKYILDNNYENVNFFCKTCGKRLDAVSLQHCSVSCEMRDPENINMRKKSCLEKYGVEYHLQAKEIKEKVRQTMHERYNCWASQLDEVKEKTKQTCLEKYGETSSWKSKEVLGKIVDSRILTWRKKNYDFLVQNLKKRDITVLLTYEEFLDTDILKLKCNKCGKVFEEKYPKNLHFFAANAVCNDCYQHYISTGEHELKEFISSILPNEEIIFNGRKLLEHFELDIYIPAKNLALEYDGIYWHSTNRSDTSPSYHLLKTRACEEKGVSLIHVFENEWINKREIVKSIIKAKLGIFETRIYARKCEVRDISTAEYREFVENNHIQGYAQASIKKGLFFNDELVSCIGIGKSRFKQNEVELIRYCTKLGYQIIGGMSKLIKNSGVKDFVSYVDRRYFSGKGYDATGFEYLSASRPGYVYICGTQVLSRQSCQKRRLPELLGDKFDPNLSESQNMTNAGYYQVYDCGMLKYHYTAK